MNMTIWFLAVTGAGIAALLYIMVMDLLDRGRKLKLKRKGRWIIARSYLVSGTVLVCTLLVTGYRQIMNLGMVELSLLYLINIAMALICVTDYTHQVIPNQVLAVLLGIWILICSLCVFHNPGEAMPFLGASVSGGLIAGMAFLLSYFASRRQLGAGDVKLAFLMGLYLTADRIIGCLLFSVVICLVFALIQIARKKLTWKSKVPLGPFLYIGTVMISVLS